MTPRAAVVFGCSGHRLTEDERRFYADARPWGFILFGRNIGTPEQVRALCSSLREAAGAADAPVLIDQEGGRVARLQPPHWPVRPPAAAFGRLHASDPARAREAAYLNYRLIARDLEALGVTVDCAPCLDLPVAGADAVIGDRALAAAPHEAVELGRIVCDALLDGGILPVLKHMPGHGRANRDSHVALPVVETSKGILGRTDFAVFRSLSTYPLGMTAHVVYADVDPRRPATLSSKVIANVIRREIGFGGVLMSDDLSMQALSGFPAQRARLALAAGCDVVLHGTGDMAEMVAVASEARVLAGDALARTEAALARRKRPSPLDAAAAEARLRSLMAETV